MQMKSKLLPTIAQVCKIYKDMGCDLFCLEISGQQFHRRFIKDSRKQLHTEICKVIEKETVKQASDYLRRRNWVGDDGMSIPDMVRFIRSEWQKMTSSSSSTKKCRKLSYNEILMQRNEILIIAKTLAEFLKSNSSPYLENFVNKALSYELIGKPLVFNHEENSNLY